ncbi:MAG: glycerol-3-phosphate acyltransferase [Clostridia bacterium]|nr:glycerol-3-phosphate acyltransferase [Clostridia bacterium]
MLYAVPVSLLMGYLMGSLNPAALLDKVKHANMRKRGTHNLGTTNTLYVLGKKWAALVLIFDMLKAFFAVQLSWWIFPLHPVAGLISGTSAVLGHIYPFYMGFKGGKGLAAFGGLVLAVDPMIFLILLGIAIVLMLLLNYSVCTPVSAGILFPILYGLKHQDLMGALVVAVAGLVLVIKNIAGFGRVRRGEEMGFRSAILKIFSGKFHAEE